MQFASNRVRNSYTKMIIRNKTQLYLPQHRSYFPLTYENNVLQAETLSGCSEKKPTTEKLLQNMRPCKQIKSF